MATYELKYTAEEIDGILESVDEKTIYGDATQSEHGLMSTTDKAKLDSLPTSQQIETSLSGKVDKVNGKGLSENDYTDAEKALVTSAYQKPQNGIPSSDLDSSVRTSLGKADTALQSFIETDPTVPSWAKQTNKPTYTASEVGALPDSTIIPTVPTISNDIATDASSTDKTASPKAVKDYVDAHGGSGGEENVIETVKVNGTALTPDSDKAVDITVPTSLESLSDDTTHRTVSDTEKSTWSGKSDFSGSYNDLTNKPTIPAAQIQSDWSQSDNTAKDFIKNKPTIPAAQVNADWNASSGVAQILNKPTIPDISGKADKATTLAGYGITDAKIESGVITLGSNTITPLTSHQSLTNYVQKSQTAGLLKNDGTVDQTQYGTYSKPSNGIPASDLESGVIPTVPVQDVTVGGTSVVSNGTAVIPAIPDVTTKADKTLVASSMPSGGFLPNTVYNLGTLSGNTTFLMAAATDNTIANIWCWTFTTPSTAPTITWPAAITDWVGGSTPTINESKSYEVTVMNGFATIIES